MKIEFTQPVLLDALAAASGSVSAKNTNSAIECFLIQSIDDSHCQIAAYDSEKGLHTTIECRVFEGGSYLLKADKLLSMVRLMSGIITIDVDSKKKATVSSFETKYELQTLEGSLFPSLPDTSVENGFAIKQKDLVSMIKATLHAIGNNDPRPELNGLFFHFTRENSSLTLVSCDSNRLAIKSKVCEMENFTEEEYRFIIPGRSVNEIMKLLSDGDEKVTVKPLRKHIVFKIGEKYFFTKLIEKEYIDYTKFIPKSSKIKATVDRDIFKAALDRIIVVVEDKDAGKSKPPVKCNFCGNSLELSSKTTTSTGNESIKIDLEGGDLTIGFNARFLVDALTAADTDKVVLSLNTPLMAMTITPEGEDEGGTFTYLVLPTKLRD